MTQARPASPITPLTATAAAETPRIGRGGRLETTRQAQLRGRVDVALLLVMRDGLLHRSEAAALTWDCILPDGHGGGRVVVQGARGTAELELGLSAMRALRAIRPGRCRPDDLVFQLSESQICNRVRQAAQAAGLEGRFSGESPRRGKLRDLLDAGAGLTHLLQAARLTSIGSLARHLD